MPFATVARNGEIEQLNQNGTAENTVEQAVAALNATMFYQVYRASNFMIPGAQAAASPAAGAVTVTTLYGDTIAANMTINGHLWAADANGTFQTSANLSIEWQIDYQTMLAGNGASLTATQRMEGNAEAVFENTGLNALPEAVENRDRVDVQREIDAIAAAMQTDQSLYGIDPTAPLTEASYLQLGETIQNNPVLEELAIQGHGLNTPPSAAYRGFTNDFQNNVDGTTLFVGGGQDNGQAAISAFFDDFGLSHLPFPVVWQNGGWVQLNQNGAAEQTSRQAALGLNNTMYRQVLVAADFSKSATAVGPVVLIKGAPAAGATPISAITAPSGQMVTLTGQVISTTITVDGHTWTAGADGLFHTANLAQEWIGNYNAMQAGNAASLTATQRAEGNAQAALMAAGLTSLSPQIQQVFREDVQRELDAMEGAIAITATALGLPQSAMMLQGSYIPVERTLHANAALEELATQGFGLTNPPASRYDGYVNDFKTLNTGVKFIGGGVNNNASDTGVFMGENIMSFSPFAVIWRNGKLVQLNQNGQSADTLSNAIQAIDDTLYNRVYNSKSFR